MNHEKVSLATYFLYVFNHSKLFACSFLFLVFFCRCRLFILDISANFSWIILPIYVLMIFSFSLFFDGCLLMIMTHWQVISSEKVFTHDFWGCRLSFCLLQKKVNNSNWSHYLLVNDCTFSWTTDFAESKQTFKSRNFCYDFFDMSVLSLQKLIAV